MNPRKKNESDADYIARLETANEALRAANKAASKVCRRTADAVRDAAMWTSLVLQHAAEITDARDSVEVVDSLVALDKLMGLPWGLEWPALPDVPKIPYARRTAPGDAAMVATSALHDLRELLSQMPAKDRQTNDIVINDLPAARSVIIEASYALADAATDLEFTLDCARPDLRPAAYAHFVRCVGDVGRMLFGVEIPRQQGEPLPADGDIPF